MCDGGESLLYDREKDKVLQCETCHGDEYITCDKCKGERKISCPDCGD
jgi:hypothetical protein